jgi:uncharacterized membrane protein
MNNDLIVITFDDADEALKVSGAMQAMRKEPLLNLDQSVIVTRDRRGKVRLHQSRNLTANGNMTNGEVLGLLTSLIFGSPIGVVWGIAVGEQIQALTQQGLDEKFVQMIEQSVGNNTSAIVFLVRRDNRSDRDEILNVLRLFKGKVHHTTISPQVECYLARLLEEGKNQNQEVP